MDGSYWAWQNQREKRPGNLTPAHQAFRGGGGDKVGMHVPKTRDSNAAVWVRDRGTQKAPERYDRHTNRQTDKQTNKLPAHYSKMCDRQS